jgi:hypothetical protein
MESNFDLDINNYTNEDLLSFFKLDNNYSLEDLTNKEEKLANEILSVSNKKYDPKYKFDIINFIKLAKDVLISLHNDIKSNTESNKEITKNIAKIVNKNKDNRVGKIINPLSEHQTLEDTIISKDNINGYSYDVTTSIYVFNTIARNNFYASLPTFSTYDLPIKWKNVISVQLAAATIPNIMYAFSYEEGTDQIYIEEDYTGLSGIVTIPTGNYSPFEPVILLGIGEASFPETLTKCINDQLGTYNGTVGRFTVKIDTSNRKITISNDTHTFSMITISRDAINNPNIPPFLQSTTCNKFYIDYGVNPPIKEKLPIALYAGTMGYLIGYRDIMYKGLKSYTGESTFNNVYSDYLYFCLDDYTGSQQLTNTYGIAEFGSIIKENILGVIPISSQAFGTTYDNNSNFIYKKRDYFGPVDISRITIKLLNQKGNLVNLHDSNFNFTLQVKTLYNLTEKTKLNLRGNGPF